MRGLIFGFITSLISNLALGQGSDDWYLVHSKNDDYGYVDNNGIVKIPFGKYSICYTDTFKILAIVAFPKKGFVAINKKEDILFEVYSFDNGPDEIKEDLFRIVGNGLIGFANSQGEIVIKPRLKFAFPFSEGLSAYCEGCVKKNDGEHSYWAEGKWGFIDKSGNIKIRASYERIIQPFTKNKARVKLNGEEFWINKQGGRI